MTASNGLELPGLIGQHPLAFLAACGLLRSCTERSGPDQPKLAWTRSRNSGEFIAVLSGETVPEISALTRALNQRCERTWKSLAFTWSAKIDNREKYRSAARELLCQEGDDESVEALAALAALASDLVTSEDSLRSTMFDLTSGNQRFLDSICVLAGRPVKKGGRPRSISEEEVREALLGPWRYRDEHHALGWDPGTQRLHALRGKLPEKDTSNRSVRAAMFLATQALQLFPCFAHGSRLDTTGFHRDDGEDWFSWPIWHDPISLDTLRSLLSHPFTSDLKRRGVDVMYRCRRVRTGGAEGNYQVLSQAQERQWTRI